MVVNGQPFFLGLLAFLATQLSPLLAGCPLDLSSSNFTLVASICSVQSDRGKCCRYINAFIAISIARYANSTTNLGVTGDLSSICLNSISQTMQLYGVPRNAMGFCGLGTKVPVNYNCKGRTTTVQMLRSPKFSKVARNCEIPFSGENSCSKCLNSGIAYVRSLVGEESNVTLSTCRDAAYAAIASRFDSASSLELASCFFQVPELHNNTRDLMSSPSPATPLGSPRPSYSTSPSANVYGDHEPKLHPSFHLTAIHAVGIAITAVALTMLMVLVVLIHRKSRELEDSENMDKNSSKTFPSPRPVLKFHEGNSPAFRKFSYKETKKATKNFSIEIGCGGFGTVYRAEFSDGAMAAVKRMNKISKQGEEEFCREIELLARLHHRHLVALKGFCVKKNERFLLYEFMGNGSLKDHLHSARTPLGWQTRIQIAIDVANALEYLHFYCDPPLCHRDIKSSNVLLDENFVAKLADFGLAHASSDGSIGFQPVNTDIRGTPGYMDPEYVVTHELTEKSDVYSYGVLLLEMITAKRAVEDGKNLVESCQVLLSSSESRSTDLVDPRIKHSFNFDQLQTIITVIRWCTQKEGQLRPSIKQVLRLLYESSDPLHSGFARAVEDDLGRSGSKGKMQRVELGFHSGDSRCLASSSSTSRSHCSRSFLLETGSSQSPPNTLSF